SRSIQGATVAGAAGVGASTLGRDSAQAVNELDTQIAEGRGATLETSTPADAGALGGGSTDAGTPADGAPDAGSTDTGSTSTDAGASGTPEVPASSEGETGASDVAGSPDAETAAPGETVATTETGPPPPSVREQYAAQSQIQMALTILIVLSVLYIVFARIDDWWRYRR
ncbi:MAG: hypothetical protein WD076_06955, partial [Parvularculaceae bacterium]